ncbi:hypothetical protein DFH09DRAFT_1375146 [Mycena vulgaris]|nr:hypothetical protein DFH09DRAFT_1375146 [Mycena vulgaris]
MPPSLHETYGLRLIAVFLESILYGMGLLQVYLYFHWYPKDGWYTKATVVAMVFLETLQIVVYFVGFYVPMIDHFGDFDNLKTISWQSLTQLTALYLSIFVAQMFFASCIYLLHTKDKVLPTIIYILAIVAVGGGMAQVGVAARIANYAKNGETSAATNTQAAVAFTADLLITGGLCWRLNSNRTGLQSTNNLLNFLIMTAVNRGVMTMVTALLNLVLFLSRPGTFYFQLMVIVSGKLYMNSLLAMLNTRQHAHMLGNATIQVSSSGVTSSTMPTSPTRMKVMSVTNETQTEMELESGIFKQTLSF